MSGFLGIYIKTLDDGGFQFYQTGFICKSLEATGMEHCNGLEMPTTVEAPLGNMRMFFRIKETGPTRMLLL